MIVAIITPNNAFVPIDWVKCLVEIKNREIIFIHGASLPLNRNKAFDYARKKEDHLLFIDADMTFTVGDVVDIERRILEGYDIVGGAYVMGTEPYPQAIFGRFDEDYDIIEPMGGLQEVDAVGSAFMAINKKVIATFPTPTTAFDYFQEGKILHGDDVSFCHRARELGFQIWCDNDIKIGHIRTKTLFP